jgi:hypothetical protein
MLVLIGRPAAGKSEVIQHLQATPAAVRAKSYHIGSLVEIDDFPLLWAWFEEDEILGQMGYQRLHTDDQGYFKFPYLWNVLVRRLELAYRKRGKEENETAIFEFSRGSEHGGYREAFRYLSTALLKEASVLYIDVSYEESQRKNRARFNPRRSGSVLEHMVPEEKLERLYRESDWHELASRDPDFLHLEGVEVPYAVLENEDDVTTRGGPALGERLGRCLNRLWHLRSIR